MKSINNPIRLMQHGAIASFYCPAAFYSELFKTFYAAFPKGYIDIYYFMFTYTPFEGGVLLNFWKEMKEYISKQNTNWFLDDYTLMVDWTSKDECSKRLEWLIDSLILVINHRKPAFYEGVFFELFFDEFYKSVVFKDNR